MKTLSLGLVLLTFLSLDASAGGSGGGGGISIRIFTPGTIRKMIGPYPARGSVAEKADFDVLLEHQRTRTEAECEEARAEEDVKLLGLFAGPNGPLTKSEAKRLQPRFLMVYAEAGANIYLSKRIYKRPRPYLRNPEVKPCVERESSYAYPSGHTAISRLFARLLSRIYPERAHAFMERADEVANNRILGGVHHPTDIIAGKKLGDALATELDARELRILAE